MVQLRHQRPVTNVVHGQRVFHNHELRNDDAC